MPSLNRFVLRYLKSKAKGRSVMGKGEELKTKPEPKIEILEGGEIFFFYRPKIGKAEAHGADDVQRMYIILRPESGKNPIENEQSSDSGKEGMKRSEEDKKEEGSADAEKEKPEGGNGAEVVNVEDQMLLRFIVMGRKSLPDTTKRSRPFWGFVELVSKKVDDMKMALKGEYNTATRGHRQQAPARALAEGIYRILRHQSGRRTHTHLIYKLEFPSEDGHNEPQEELSIEREGSFVIQIKNPEQSSCDGSAFGGLKNKRRAAFPASLQGGFGKRRFAAADPPDFLNYEGCEFLLISPSDDIDKELGLNLKTEEEETIESCSDLIKMFGDSASSKPMFSGAWV